MPHVAEVQVNARDLQAMSPLVGEALVRRCLDQAESLRGRLDGNVVWNVNSTAAGGGVAEMLVPLVAYARGLGVDVRWVVINGSAPFFTLTKRLHHALHGSRGDDSPLGSKEHAVYEEILRENAVELLARIRRGDIVVLHDPQTAGLAPALTEAGAHLVWRCHIGTEHRNEQTKLGWRFLEPYLAHVSHFVFSRADYVPELCSRDATAIIQPSIDAFCPKNQDLSDADARQILRYVGILDGAVSSEATDFDARRFTRDDGTAARIEHKADLIRMGRAPDAGTPLIVQVSRWDPLKDPIGVMHGFVRMLEQHRADAELLLAGPTVYSVADDPEADAVFLDVLAAWRALPHAMRDRVTLACLPMHDRSENAIIVNAIQRHAQIVIQKSLYEGFGLTVTEAMWKARPVIASRVGGIQDQIEDGRSGILLDDPADFDAFAASLYRLLSDEKLRDSLGLAGRERVRENFLVTRHLLDYAELFLAMLSSGNRGRA